MTRSRPIVCVLVSAGLAAASCSVAESLRLPSCADDNSTVIVAAQSVPSAQLLPCLGPTAPTLTATDSLVGPTLPSGWERDTVTIDEGGTTVRLDSDRAGTGAAVLHFEASCEIGEAVPVPSDQEGAMTYEFIERLEPGLRASRYYVFPGGCVWWDFDFAEGAPAALAIELQAHLFLLPREFLSQSLSESFIEVEV